MKQTEPLTAEAEKLENTEKLIVIEDIRAKIKLYGITANDLGFVASQNSNNQVKKQKFIVPTKYCNSETGQEWSGRGSSPKWIVEAKKAGKKKEDFLVGSDFISKKYLKKANVKPKHKIPKKSFDEQCEDAQLKYERRQFKYVLKLARKHFSDMYKEKRSLAMKKFKGGWLSRSQFMKMSYDPKYVGFAPDEILIGNYIQGRDELITHLEFHGCPDLLDVWEIEAEHNARMPKILQNPPKSEVDSVAIAESNKLLKKLNERNSGKNKKDRFKGIKV